MEKEEVQNVLNELQGVRPEMLNGEAKRLFEAIMKIANERDEINDKYDKLVKVAIETTFDGANEDTEFLARVLLKQGQIGLNDESKCYINPHTDEEFEVYGMKYEKEKCYLIDEDRLDDYTKQLEYKYNQLEEEYKEFRKQHSDFDSYWIHEDDYNKLKKQTEMSAKEFEKTLDRLNKMIDLLIEDLQSEGCLINMTSEEIYKYYEKRVNS